MNDTKLETQTREEIDQQLEAAGWVIQDKNRMNLIEGLGVAVREMDTETGPADYMLFINAKACGIIEAKREGSDLGGVAEQSARYATSHTKHIERWVPDSDPLPFLYEATNHEIRFRDERDPHPRSRHLFHFHRPETLKAWLEEDDTLRSRMLNLPELNTENLRRCQIDAITGIEHSLKQGKPRALLQMATGSGKTYTAVTEVYRLAKFAKIKRVLFLVDRGNLATNAKDEFEQFVIPHDGRKFTQHYNVNILGRAGIPDATKVTISTIQRMYSQLAGSELDDEADEHSGFEIEASSINKQPRPVAYNANIPIEEFDVIIIDECHRSIYNLWRQVLEYFDAKPASKTAWTKKLWIYDFRTNVHMTLKTKKLVKSDFDEFISLYKADDRSKRRESKKAERWKSFKYDELIARDKTNLDIFWLKDDSLEDTENLPAPEVIAQEIVEQLEAALEEFRSVESILGVNNSVD